MAVQLKISSIKSINGSSLSSVVDLANFNFNTLKSALDEFLTSINYDQNTRVTVDIEGISVDTIIVREGLTVYGAQQQNGVFPEVIKLLPTGAITAKNVVAEDVVEGKRLRLKVFGQLPPTGVPGEIVYITAQGNRIEGFYGYLVSTGWTLLSGGGGSGSGCRASVTRSVAPEIISGDGELISYGLTPMPAPLTTSEYLLFINGQQMIIGNGTTSAPAYFSKDGGLTATPYGYVDSADELYWNTSVAGYGLDNTDFVTLMYSTADPYCSATGVVCSTGLVLPGTNTVSYSQLGVNIVLDQTVAQTSPITVCLVPVPANPPIGVLPAGYFLNNAALAYEITTPLAVGAIIEFTLPQSMSQAVFETVRIFHEVNGVYIDETVLTGLYAPNYATRKIYAQVSSFSPFYAIPFQGTPTTTTTNPVLTTTVEPTTTSTTTLAPTTTVEPTTTTTSYCDMFSVQVELVGESRLSFRISGPEESIYSIYQYDIRLWVDLVINSKELSLEQSGPIRVSIDELCNFCYFYDYDSQTIELISCDEYPNYTTTTTTSTTLAPITTSTTLAPTTSTTEEPTTTLEPTTTTTTLEPTTTTTTECLALNITYSIDEDVLTLTFNIPTSSIEGLRIINPFGEILLFDQYSVRFENDTTIISDILLVEYGQWTIILGDCDYSITVEQIEPTTTTLEPTTTTTTEETTTTTTTLEPTTTTTTTLCPDLVITGQYVEPDYVITISLDNSLITTFELQSGVGDIIEQGSYEIASEEVGITMVTVYETQIDSYILVINSCVYYLNPGETTTTTTE